jgi:hypothetical protein
LKGTPTSVADVSAVFVGFCKGEVDRLPWSETPGLKRCDHQHVCTKPPTITTAKLLYAVARETTPLSLKLMALNERGVLTVNSQPSANGVASTDPAVGWGGPGGYVYQKVRYATHGHLSSLGRACGLNFQWGCAAGHRDTSSSSRRQKRPPKSRKRAGPALPSHSKLPTRWAQHVCALSKGVV